MSFGTPPVQPGRYEDEPAPEPKSERRNTSVPRTPATSGAVQKAPAQLPGTSGFAKLCYVLLLAVALWPTLTIFDLMIASSASAELPRLIGLFLRLALSLGTVILGYIVCRAIDRLTS